MSDHVHALFRLSKNLALAKIVEEVKTSSSKWVKTQGRGILVKQGRLAIELGGVLV
jgi:REP element-mobilizing transposase RayT